MRISMWILAEWLKPFNPTVKIEDGKQVLRNVRLLTDDIKTESFNVYLGDSGNYFSNDSLGVVCVSGNDTITINDYNVEDVFNEILNAFDFYNEWHDTLQEKIDSECTLQDLIDLSDKVFNLPILIAGASHEILAISSENSFKNINEPLHSDIINNKILPLNVISKLNQDLHGKQHLEQPYEFKSNIFKKISLHKNIFRGNEHVGFLIMIQNNQGFSNSMYQLFNTFGNIISNWMLKNFTKDSPSAQSEIFSDLLNGESKDDSTILLKMNYIDWFQTDEKYLIKIMAVANNERIYKALKHKIQQTFSGCYILLHESSIVLILNTNIIDLNTLLSDLAILMKQSQTYCGISYPFFDIKSIKQAYKQAEIALDFGKTESGTLNFCENYSMTYIKKVLKDCINIELKHQSLKQLKAYDLKNETDYYNTLWEYLHNERNKGLTSEIMKIHRNTLNYRVNRIEEIIGANLDDAQIRDHILISYFLEKEL